MVLPVNNSLPDFSSYGYSVIRELGHNYSGGRVTYLAIEIATSQSIVIKQFQFARTTTNWSGYKALEREIEVLQGLNHRGIPRYLGSLSTPEGMCILQEYKNATPLSTKRCWSLDEVKQIAENVLSILEYLQTRLPPVIHRDIKPENILVDENIENVYLVDFGLARIDDKDQAMSSIVVGTTGLMPPEQWFNQQLTCASDLYSLGATLVCLFSGVSSVNLSKYIDETYRIDIDNFLHTAINFEFKQWLRKMVAPRKSDRFIDAAAALSALKGIDYNNLVADDKKNGLNLQIPTDNLTRFEEVSVTAGVFATILIGILLAYGLKTASLLNYYANTGSLGVGIFLQTCNALLTLSGVVNFVLGVVLLRKENYKFLLNFQILAIVTTGQVLFNFLLSYVINTFT